jgi:hypothetical protein
VAVAAEADAFAQLRARMRESCAKMPRWSAPIRMKSLPLEVGRILWHCPASFRLEYRGPGSFDYSSNGNEAWIARPSFDAPKPEIEHYWRLRGSDLDLVLAYLAGDDSRLAAIRENYKATSSSKKGVWGVTLTPFRTEDFASMRFDWNLATADLMSVEWLGPEGVLLAFEVGTPVAPPAGSAALSIVPKIPAGARVTKYPKVVPAKNKKK